MLRRIVLLKSVRPLLGTLVGFALATLLLLASRHNPWEAFAEMFSGATGLQGGPVIAPGDIAFGIGSWHAHLSTFLLGQSLTKATPLLFTGLAVSLGLRAGLFNIGVSGQMTMGALGAAAAGTWSDAAGKGWPPCVHILLILSAGAAAGGFWGCLPGLLKTMRGVHEVISTIMLNYIAANIGDYLIEHSLKDPDSLTPASFEIGHSSWLVPLIPGTNLTVALIIGLGAAVAFAFFIQRTAFGFAIRAVGLGAEAARTFGISVSRVQVTTLTLSGALAGLAGACEVLSVHHRYLQGVAGSYGFDGIAVALLGNLGGVGVICSSMFFGGLTSGTAYLQFQTQVPASLSTIVEAVVIAVVGIRFVQQPAVTAQPQSPPQPAEEEKPAHASL